jgi:hypothetical protein
LEHDTAHRRVDERPYQRLVALLCTNGENGWEFDRVLASSTDDSFEYILLKKRTAS